MKRLDNPLPMEERHGLHLFHGDQFSVNRTFSCASCHPDGDTDHLTWRLDCTDGLRATMTLRQVNDTLTYHWSGDDDAVTFTAALPKPGAEPFSVARDAQPFLFTVTRKAGFPIACAEGYPEQVADFVAGEGAVPLTIYALNLGDEPAAVFVNGERMAGSPAFVAAATYSWTLPAVPGDAATLVFQLQSAGGLLSNEVAALVVRHPLSRKGPSRAPTRRRGVARAELADRTSTIFGCVARWTVGDRRRTDIGEEPCGALASRPV